MEWNSDYIGEYRIAYQGDLSNLVETLKLVWSEEDPLNGIYRGAREAEGRPYPFRFKGARAPAQMRVNTNF